MNEKKTAEEEEFTAGKNESSEFCFFFNKVLYNN
jgi:hypothetical protein